MNNDLSLSPLVSVVLPVYNGQDYLTTAIESILDQTYSNFELIIINDGSTDSSKTVIDSFSDSRIRYYDQKNQGLAATLNKGVSMAKGAYIARQDQDDVSEPTRLEKQLAFLQHHPKCGMVGTWALIYEEEKDTRRALKHPTASWQLKFELLFDNPFIHSSVLIRKSVFNTVGPYTIDPRRQPPEDYELWSRIAEKFEVANIPEFLHLYRGTKSGMSRDINNPFTDHVITISAENIARLLDKNPLDKTILAFATLIHKPISKETNVTLAEVNSLLDELFKKISSLPESDRSVLKKRAQTLRTIIAYNYPQSAISKSARFTMLKLQQAKNKFSGMRGMT